MLDIDVMEKEQMIKELDVLRERLREEKAKVAALEEQMRPLKIELRQLKNKRDETDLQYRNLLVKIYARKRKPAAKTPA